MRRSKSAVIVFLAAAAVLAASPSLSLQVSKRGEPDTNSKTEKSFTVELPGAVPKGKDSYICSGFKIEETVGADNPIFMTKFEPVNAEADRAHHMILYLCDSASAGKGKTYDCGHHMVCGSGSPSIVYAWAKNADPTVLPDDVSFEIDRSKHKYFVLQVHYVNEIEGKDYTGLNISYITEPTSKLANILLLVKNWMTIPAGKPSVTGDISCLMSLDAPIHPFAYRTHAHSLGSVITGYVYNSDTNVYKEIAKGSPQWPQAFYPMKEDVVVKSGEYLIARCTYNTTQITQGVRIGMTAGDEMCNLYIMYYTTRENSRYRMCMSDSYPTLSKNLPRSSKEPPPYNAMLEQKAKSHVKSKDLGEVTDDDNDSQKRTGRRKGDLDRPVGNEAAVDTGEKIYEIKMPGALPDKNDDYLCSAFSIKNMTRGAKGKTIHVTAFNAEATASKAHHLILQKCKQPYKVEGQIWNCMHHSVCMSGSSIIYAWAKNAPPTSLPADVGFELDEEEDGYIVMQVHYKHKLPDKDYTGVSLTYVEKQPKYKAGILLMVKSGLTIMPGHMNVHSDMNCKIFEDITLFAFRTHAHSLGAVITGYKVKEGKFEEVARGDPQRPQTFYPMKKFVEIKKGDIMAARCTFDSTRTNKTTVIGSTAGDEMCNLYVMYYTDRANGDFKICVDEQFPAISDSIPANSDDRLPAIKEEEEEEDSSISYSNGAAPAPTTPAKEKKTHQEQGYYPWRSNKIRTYNGYPQQFPLPPSSNYGYGYSQPYAPQQQPMLPPLQQQQQYPSYGYQQPVMPPLQQGYGFNTNPIGSGVYGNSLGPAAAEQQPVEPAKEEITTESAITTAKSKTRARRPITSIHGVQDDPSRQPRQHFTDGHLHPVLDWPQKETADRLGQISGVSLDVFGNVVIFHRGDRTWSAMTFIGNQYHGNRNRPIEENTILTLNSSGHVINEWGAGLFFMPHMLTVDKKNNIWLTDVALHQVFKFGPYGGDTKKPLMVLGTPFEPGKDDVHYCKPTSVAVTDDTNYFFVADGYCNSRIIKYSVSLNATSGHHVVQKVFQIGKAEMSGFSFSKGPTAFNIPHSLTLAEDKNMICVADRENGRIQCFNAQTGKFVSSIQPQEMGRTVYGISYAKAEGGRLYAVGGPEPFGAVTNKRTQGYVIDINNGKVVSTFNGGGDNGFENPHDIAVSEDGSVLYEVELRPFKVWKLTNGRGSVMPTYPAVPTNNGDSGGNPADMSSNPIRNLNLENLGNLIPKSNLSVLIAVCSVSLTCLISLCLCCRRCRKRGRRNLKTKSSKKGDGKLDLGDFLGRSKDGFQPLKQEDDEDDDGVRGNSVHLSSDESDLEEFSVPTLRA